MWPALRAKIQGEYILVETQATDKMRRLLDCFAGIDGFIFRRSECVMYGLASRVQWANGDPRYPYNSFTVRMARASGAKTEYEKRKHALQHPGTLYPHYTAQAYLNHDGSQLLSLALATTSDVIACLDRIPGRCRVNQDDKTTFRPVFWQDMLNQNADIIAWAEGRRMTAVYDKPSSPDDCPQLCLPLE